MLWSLKDAFLVKSVYICLTILWWAYCDGHWHQTSQPHIAVWCVCVCVGGGGGGGGLVWWLGGFGWLGLLLKWINLNVSISNHIHQNVWDEITYPFPKFNSCTFEVCKWISNITNHTLRGLGLHTHARIKDNPACQLKYTESHEYGFSFSYQIICHGRLINMPIVPSLCLLSIKRLRLTSQWRHNERDDVSNHQCLHCLLSMLWLIKIHQTFILLITCEGWIYANKGSVMQ